MINNGMNMSAFIDAKYVNLLSHRLQKFKKKTDYLWNFRCPICGDSKKSLSKARGYVYRKKNDLFYRCHNCGAGLTFGNFIKKVDSVLHTQYVVERYKGGVAGKGSNTAEPKFSFAPPQFKTKIELPTISSLPSDHYARVYVENRQLPRQFSKSLYYAHDFKEWVESITDKPYELQKNDPRIVIPFYSREKILVAFQGRALGDSKLRYITIKLIEDFPKIFGLDRWNSKKKTYVVEGPFDSMFLPNCLAMAGADAFVSERHDIYEDFLNSDVTYIFDNEPRNKEIIKRMNSIIENGFNICIWPDGLEKDLNDMVTAGKTSNQILSIINKNTYQDLSAKMKMTNWKRV